LRGFSGVAQTSKIATVYMLTNSYIGGALTARVMFRLTIEA
jgi:hypothetical protein